MTVTSAMFIVGKQRHGLMTPSPDVEFCGYSAPHPSEDKIHMRIQMYGEWLLPGYCSRSARCTCAHDYQTVFQRSTVFERVWRICATC
jgi:DNA-directed RNA polymerase subunit L